jgi:hypothetical protein
VVFENVTVAGRTVTKPEDANLELDPTTVTGVKVLSGK